MNTTKRPRGRPKSQFRESSAGTMKSLDRALGILVAVSRTGRATLTELSLSQGVPTATTHRILMTLQKHGFVSFNEDLQDWSIGIEAYRTGASFVNRSSLIEVSRPIMQHLMEATGETANLAVQDQAEVVFIEQVETTNPIRAFFARGTRTAMHASGTGKAILASLPTEQVHRLLMGAGLTAYTSKTLTTPAGLFDDLQRTAERGYSFDGEERHLGMSCIGSTIYDERAKACGGVSISGPSTRFDPQRVPELGAIVKSAAAEITKRIGGRSPVSSASERSVVNPDAQTRP